MSNSEVSRSWFAVLNNPANNGYEGSSEMVCEKLKNEWVQGSSTRSGYFVYCISKEGMHHVHMVLEDKVSMRFTKIKKMFPKVHLEASKGNKSQILSYIKKEPPFDEKGEKIIYTTFKGEIVGTIPERKSKYQILLEIRELVEQGLNPEEIMDRDIRYRKEKTVVRDEYMQKRYKETPTKRDINVVWHFGETNTGKSYIYVLLCEKYGDDKVYLFNDYSNNCSAGFDMYLGEPILFIDELKYGAIPYEKLLVILDGYRSQIHCRYANAYCLWTEVHISSVLAPEDIYASIVVANDTEKDSVGQLLRRINKYVYHYISNGEYKTYEVDGKKYSGYEQVKLEAMADEVINSEPNNNKGDI